MATTAETIRARMATLITSIVPAVHAAQRFIESQHVGVFQDVYDQNSASCLRRFSVRSVGDTSQALVTDHTVERVESAMVVEVAYPTDFRHGGRQLVGLDNAIDLDATKIEAYVGVPSSDATLKGLATIFRDAPYERTLSPSGAATFLTITYRVEYARSLT